MRTKPEFRQTDFFTIPDAPNYEINGYFKVRNKKTGRFKNSKKRVGKPTVVVSLRHNGKEIKRDVKTFYRQALDAAFETALWFPIGSLENNYEISIGGDVRNAHTKKLLKPILDQNCLYYHLSLNGQNVHRTRSSLLNEVFDANIRRKKAPIPIILRKDKLAYSFKNLTAAAKWLSSKVDRHFDFIRKFMHKRLNIIYGYQIQYLGG